MVDCVALDAAGLDVAEFVDVLQPEATDWIDLEPYQVRWLIDPESYRTVPAPPTEI